MLLFGVLYLRGCYCDVTIGNSVSDTLPDQTQEITATIIKSVVKRDTPEALPRSQ